MNKEQNVQDTHVSQHSSNEMLCEVCPPKEKWEVIEEQLAGISTEYLMWELVNRLENDICQTYRFIKEIEAIKFSKEQCEILKRVLAPNFTTDKNGRLINLYHIVSDKGMAVSF